MSMMSPRRACLSLTVLAVACLTATTIAAPAQPLANDKDKASYAIGMQIGAGIVRSLEPVKADVDSAVVLRGIEAMVTGAKPLMTVPEAQAQLEAFNKKMQVKQQAQAADLGRKNLAEGTAFLAANAKKPGVKTTASGIQYLVEKQGSGPKPKATDSVKVNYTGSLLNGTVFDASAQHGGAAMMKLDQVIPGWTEGVQLMPIGSKYVFWIPAKLAYGEKGTPGGPIGPNATLKFEIELVSIGAK